MDNDGIRPLEEYTRTVREENGRARSCEGLSQPLDVRANDVFVPNDDTRPYNIQPVVNNKVVHDVNAIVPVPYLTVIQYEHREMPYLSSLELEREKPTEINASVELNVPGNAEDMLSILQEFAIPEPFRALETVCTEKEFIQRICVPFEVQGGSNENTYGLQETLLRDAIVSDSRKNRMSFSRKNHTSSDHVVPDNGIVSLTAQTEVEVFASDHERFLVEMSHGTAQWLHNSTDHTYPCSQPLKIQTLCELHEPREVLAKSESDVSSEYNNTSNSYVPRTHYERTHRAELGRSSDLSETSAGNKETPVESRNHLNQLLTKLMNKSYDEINVKLEDDANILIVEVKETTGLSAEEVTSLEQCEFRRYNYASRSRSVDDTVVNMKPKLAHCNSCDQLLLCNRNTYTRRVRKVDLLVSHFTMSHMGEQASKDTVQGPSMNTSRSQNFTQSLNTILGGKQTKSVSFALQIDKIETPQRTRDNVRKSKSGSKKTKSCCID